MLNKTFELHDEYFVNAIFLKIIITFYRVVVMNEPRELQRGLV